MRKSIVVVDNFYDDLDAVRRYALTSQWYTPYEPPGGAASWSSTRYREAADCPFKSSARLIQTLEDLTGDRIDLDDWKATFPTTPDGRADMSPEVRRAGTLWNCTFHFKPARNRQRIGQGVHNHVVDAWNGVGVEGWAGLVYLDPRAPLDGGLRLWRNIDPAHDLDWMTDPANWELIDTFGNVANRLILHRGSLPHSGSAGWGELPENGRLYQTFFFKVEPTVHPRSLHVGEADVS
jgi:hypothetical protein